MSKSRYLILSRSSRTRGLLHLLEHSAPVYKLTLGLGSESKIMIWQMGYQLLLVAGQNSLVRFWLI